MTQRIAAVLSASGAAPDRKLLGLTVGERLLLTLEKADISHVVFIGDGTQPTSTRSTLQPMRQQEVPPEGYVWVVPSDAVIDAGLLQDDTLLPEDLPIRRIPVSELPQNETEVTSLLSSLGNGRALSGKGYAVRILDDAAVKAAENALMKSLVKEADGVISRYLNRKISTFFSRRLAPLPITPNMVTAVVFLIGVLSGPLAFLGTPLGFALGGFCYWFSAVLDGCDGEISRLKYLGSPLGAWLDTVVDDLVCLSYISGMYLSLARTAGHPYWGWTGLAAVGFFLLTILPRYYVMAVRSGSGDYQKLAKETRDETPGAVSKILLGLRDFVFRTDFLPFAGMATAILGVPEIFAAPFALGAFASAIDSFVKLFSYRPDTA